MYGAFTARSVFPTLDSLPRSYYLGHHAAGLSKMRTMLSQIDLIIECRDYRVPLTSRNPLFEESLAGRERLVVYTKKDLASHWRSEDAERERLLRQYHAPAGVLFSDHHSRADTRLILDFARAHATAGKSLTGSRMMVVGMPNVGKSSLLNALRREGVNKGKVAHTGAQPGVTRKIATAVKIIEPADGENWGEGVYLLDTPGVFIPYVPDADTMLKLALCGSVKDTIIAPTTLADYLLFHINLVNPHLYAEYSPPTNDAMQLLDAIARKTGRLQKGGVPDTESVALWMIQRWRNGHLGRFVLDEVSVDALMKAGAHGGRGISMNQARKAGKEAIRVKNRLKRNNADVG